MRRESSALLAATAFLGLVAGTLVACSDDATRRRLERALADHATHVKEPQRRVIARAIAEGAAKTGVDPFLLLAVVERESRFRAEAKSRGGAVGLMQLRPRTARALAQDLGIPPPSERALQDPRTNVRLGATYLAQLHDELRSWDLALTGYNRGPSRARRLAASGRRPSSRYAGRILERRDAFRARYAN